MDPGFPTSDRHQRPQPPPAGDQEGPAHKAREVTGAKQSLEYVAEPPNSSKHTKDCSPSPPVTASLVLRASRYVLVKVKLQRRRDPLPRRLLPRKTQPLAPALELAPLRARPRRLYPIRIRPVWPALDRRISGRAGRLHRWCGGDLRDRSRQPLSSIGHVARWVNRKEAPMRLATDNHQVGRRAGLALATRMLLETAAVPRTFGARRRHRQFHIPLPDLVQPVVAHDEIGLALSALPMTCSLALQRNTLKVGSVLGSGLLPFWTIEIRRATRMDPRRLTPDRLHSLTRNLQREGDHAAIGRAT